MSNLIKILALGFTGLLINGVPKTSGFDIKQSNKVNVKARRHSKTLAKVINLEDDNFLGAKGLGLEPHKVNKKICLDKKMNEITTSKLKLQISNRINCHEDFKSNNKPNILDVSINNPTESSSSVTVERSVRHKRAINTTSRFRLYRMLGIQFDKNKNFTYALEYRRFARKMNTMNRIKSGNVIYFGFRIKY